MKSTAFLINTSHGPIVDQAALIRTLEARAIAGATLDVFDKEPLESDSPLPTLDNVILTSHSVGMDGRAVSGYGKDRLRGRN